MTETPQVHPSPEDDKTLCRLAVRHNMLTEEQVRSALTLKERERKLGRELGVEEIVRKKGWVSSKQLEILRQARDLLKLRARERSFAREVVEKGLVSQEQVEEVLREQTRLYKQEGRFIALEEILNEQGALNSEKAPPTEAIAELEPEAANPKAAASAIAPEGEPVCTAHSGASTQLGAGPGSDADGTNPVDRLGKVVYRDVAFDLIVSNDGMQAFLRLKGSAPSDLPVGRLVGLMESKGISHGLVEDHLLRRGLKQRSEKSIVFKVAQGLQAKPGRDAEVRFFLTSEPGRSQEETQTAPMSLKDRGAIPQVKQGDLLAEKIPRIPGVDGIDVYGTPIVVPEVKDEVLLCGSGVSLTDDGLRATAKVDGRAMFSAYGKLTVLEEHTIPSDVSFETGNIDFKGIVIVHGVVQDGFKVRCGSLVCNEIGRAEIDTAGNVTVFGGVLGAQVRCQGDLTCVHIHASLVEALGDVYAEKGIVDSKVKTSGKCVVKSGAAVASLVYAKKGIEAVQIGHERSRPCTLAIGFDPLMEKELERLKAVIAAKEAEGSQQKDAIEELRAQLLNAEQRTGEIAQLQDLTLRERRTTVGMLDDAKRLQDLSLVPELEEAVSELDARARETERELDELLEMQDQLKTLIRVHKETARGIEKEIASAKEEIAVITSWGQSAPAIVAVRVRDKIFSGTSIRGPCAIATLKDTLSGVSIREMTVDAASGETAMRVTRLR